MPKLTRIVTLNLGCQTIGLAEFGPQPNGGLVLLNYRLREVVLDPAKGMRQAQVASTLREMMAEIQIKHESVNYAVPAQSVFARFVKLPAVEEEKIERIIAFEAQQNVPFPIDEVVWDYQLIGGGGEEQIQVVLVAIKADLLDEINGAVEETGLRTVVVDVATMALYNAFRYNYSELSGCSLLVDIGARTTNLLFVEPQKIFSRTIPIGGSSVTAAIAKEFVEPFAAADFRKKRDGFVCLDAYAEPSDPEVARVSKLMRSTMTRLHAEVMRSISHYRAQQQGNAPERLFLCGGMASTPYMREFFREKLQLPVEYFDSLRNVAVAPTAPVEELTCSAHLLGELVGLALRTIADCPMSLSLRPAVVARRQQLEKRRPFFVMAAAAVVLAVLGWGFYYARASSLTAAAAEKIRNINAPMRAAEAKIDKLRQQAGKLDAVSVPIVSAINDRFFWTQILEDLNARLPKEDIWITELVPTSGRRPIGYDQKPSAEAAPPPVAGPRPVAKDPNTGSAFDGLLLRGLYLYNAKQQEVVVDYFRNLVGSPFFNVDPNNQARAIKSTIPNNTEWAFPYELRLDLKKPVPLP